MQLLMDGFKHRLTLEQGPPGSPINGTRQMHDVARLLPAGEVVLTGQDVQLPTPGLVLYELTGQGTHGPPAGPVKPALQTQSVTAADPAGELDCAGHAFWFADIEPAGQKWLMLHAPEQLLVVSPVELPNRPAKHRPEHEDDP